ncbi:GGDEF domain-containing protein [Pseudomonas sp. MS19]|nr:GGDEF domain-containing protein [Pseudomonas sp. MS19]
MPAWMLSRSHKNIALSVLVLIVVAMLGLLTAALLLAGQQANQLAAPNLHGELWRSYQTTREMERTLEAARQFQQGEISADDLVVRVQVLRSSTRMLQDGKMFSALPLPRPRADEALARIISLSSTWNKQAHFADEQAAQRLAIQINREMTPLIKPMHEVMIASNISLANKLDHDRQLLYKSFCYIGWTLISLLIGSALLVAKLIYNYREARQLSSRLSELNHTLEDRVAMRTLELSEEQRVLNQILQASPSDVAFFSATGDEIYFMSEGLRLNPQGPPNTFEYAQFFADPADAERFYANLINAKHVDDLEALLRGPSAPYCAVVSGRVLEHKGRPAHLIWCYDISVRKKMEESLLALANTDALTGLDNRHSFWRKAEELLHYSKLLEQHCVALMLDIDHFKQINDKYGHQAGDLALQLVATTLQLGVREDDILGRIGGEEFVVLLPHTCAEQALPIAERLRSSIEALHLQLDNGQRHSMTLSIGLASMTPNESLDQLLNRADMALYEAKAAGRNRISICPAPTLKQTQPLSVD